MKTIHKVFLIVAALGLLAAAGCKPLDLSMQRNRIFLLGRLLVGQTCDVRVIWRKAPEDTAPVTVTADLSEIGGGAEQVLTAGDNGTWRWAGQVTPAVQGERLITITAVDAGAQKKEVSKRFRVFDTAKAIAIAAETDYDTTSLALKADGTVVEWRLQDGSRIETPDGLADVTAIAVGSVQRLALKADGTVVAWGCEYEYDYDYGQCDVPAGLSDVVAIAAGYAGSLALRADGVVVVWGCNDPSYGSGLCDAPAGLTDVVAIAAYAAVKADGTLKTWPDNYTMSDVVAVSKGGYALLALKSDGTIEQSTYITALSFPLRMRTVRATAISGGYTSNIALQKDGSVVVWDDFKYECFHRLKNIIAVAAGARDAFLALAEDGSVSAWQEPWTTVAVTELQVPEELK